MHAWPADHPDHDQHEADPELPQYWQFWIGLVLVVIVLVGRARMHRWALWAAEPDCPEQRAKGHRRRPRERRAMSIALETRGLEKQFGGLKVTRDLSLKIEAGARHALIGPNGAGKTTVINLLTGVLKPNGGRILLEGNDITDLPVHRRVLRGLSRTFQINQLYRRSDAARDHRACGVGTSGPRRRLVAA